MADQLPHRARLGGATAPPPERIPRRLLASWQRSEEYGVSLESVEPAFTGSFDNESLFFECGKQVLADLHAVLASEPISLMLTDADGLVLNRLSGDHALLRALDRVHLAPGFGYSEREAGTNGLALALADRLPTVVRAEEHYSMSLCAYTCAAAPVTDPLTGRLEGSVNLTTWSESSAELLLALAQTAASNTSALMLARSAGPRPRPAPRGQVFRVESARLEPGSGTVVELSAAWQEALGLARAAMAQGQVVAAVGEAGSGRSTLLAQAARRHRPRNRILGASTPAPADVEPWLALWTPELGKPHTSVIVEHVDALPMWVAERLGDLVTSARGAHDAVDLPVALTADSFDHIPDQLARLVDTVVPVPPLRDRPDDVLPLTRHLVRRVRGRDIAVTAAAAQALEGHAWPGNVSELHEVVRQAALHANTIDLRQLPPSVLAGSGRRLSRIETFERDEIVRVLTTPGITMPQAAERLGMSRATVYRKLAQYDIRLPRR